MDEQGMKAQAWQEGRDAVFKQYFAGKWATIQNPYKPIWDFPPTYHGMCAALVDEISVAPACKCECKGEQ
jgi:hypothetical protein